MKQKIVDAFDGVIMSDSCEQRIRQAMAKKGRCRSFPVFKYAGMLTAALALVLCLSPAARAAVKTVVERYVFPDSDITLYKELNENGDVVKTVGYVDTEHPAFAQLRDGRLYFLGNGENIDITDQITEESPYYYSYRDHYGLTHYMAVGYSGTLENYGIYEFIREETEGQTDREGWLTGSGRNILDPETEKRYPWVDLVWEALNVPWPMPE